ncbi:MAG: hypothetical protein ACRD3Q_08800 [Terriglobales bacterium]
MYVPNFLPGVIAFSLPEKRFLPSYLWPALILLLTLAFYAHPSRRLGGVACLAVGFGVPYFKEITFRPLTFVANRIATYSYGIYLGHSFFIWWALTERNNLILFWLMWLTIPAALYHAFERPAVEVGKRVAQRLLKSRKPIFQVEPQAQRVSAKSREPLKSAG